MAYSDIPKPVRSDMVVVDPVRGMPERVMQFNPDTLQRSFAPQAAGDQQQGNRVEALRLKGTVIVSRSCSIVVDDGCCPKREWRERYLPEGFPFLPRLVECVGADSTALNDLYWYALIWVQISKQVGDNEF